MKNYILVSCVLLLTPSLYAMKNSTENIFLQKRKEVSVHYAPQTIELLKNFWVNTLGNISGKKQFKIVRQIKLIKSDPANTYEVLNNFRIALSKTTHLIIDINENDTHFDKTNKIILGQMLEFYTNTNQEALATTIYNKSQFLS